MLKSTNYGIIKHFVDVTCNLFPDVYHMGTIRFPTVEENIVVSLVARVIFHVLLIGKLGWQNLFCRVRSRWGGRLDERDGWKLAYMFWQIPSLQPREY